MLNWKSRSLGEKVILELLAIIVISQINRFDVMIYIGVLLGVPALGAALAMLVAIGGLVLLIDFVINLIKWVKSLKRGGGRSKIVAVFLALIPFGIWSWLYTYKDDAKKFWLNLVLSIVTLSLWGYVAWVWAIIDRLSKPSSYYEKYKQTARTTETSNEVN